MNKAIFFFFSLVFFWLLSLMFVEDPPHLSRRFESLKRKDKRMLVLLNDVARVEQISFYWSHL